jgi:long-subunit fatty acid transport protein
MKLIFIYFIIILFSINLYSNGGDFWGINSKNLSLGGDQTAGVNDYTAAFYNPAKLPFIGLSNGIGYQYSKYNLNISLDDNRDQETKNFFKIDKPQKIQDSYSSYTIGFTIPIFNTENYGLSIGFVNNYIENDVAKISIFDEKIYQFYKYHSNVETLLMNLGVGFKFLKRYSIGVGVAQLVSVIGETNVQFELGNDTDTDPANNSIISGKDLYLGVVNERAYNFSFFMEYGIYSIGLIYKQSLSLPYKIPATITLKNFNGQDKDAHLDLLIEGVGLWLPPKINLGFALDLKKYINSLFYFNVSYEFWSEAPVPYSLTSVNSDATLLKIDDLKSDQGVIEYKDSINISIGYTLIILKDNELNMGFSYRPSIVKKHDSRTNIIDTDVLSSSIGAKIKLLPMFENSKNLYLNLAYSLQHNFEKNEYSSYYKSNVNYGGNIHLFFIDISYE